MLNYAICEISGKQYKVIPGIPLEIDFQEDIGKKLAVEVLLISDGKVKLGKPFLKEKLILEVLGNTQGDKVRVAKFHAKANYRKVIGIRPKFTKVVLNVKKDSSS